MTPGRRRICAAAIFLGVTLLYYASNPRVPDAYKHHVYVADAWLHGRLWVSGYPGHYHDWILVDGKVHSPFGPTPAMLLVPFVWWSGPSVNMNIFSMAIAGLNAALCWLLLLRVPGIGPRRAALGTLIFAFATVNWFTAIIGTTWFLSHLCVELFLLLALLEVFGRGRAILVGAAVGFAVLARVNIATVIPGVLLLLIDWHAVRRNWLRFVDGRAFVRALFFGIGIAIPAALEMALNYARFGNPFETGYGQASEIYANRGYGWYDWHYIPRHLYVSIFKGWEWIDDFPFLKPSPEGLSILLTSPVLLYAFAATWRDRTVRMLWLCALLTAAALFPYFYQGWVQFGYRYVLDALPYVIILTAVGMAGRPLGPIMFLAVFSVLSNALGVYWGEKLGW